MHRNISEITTQGGKMKRFIQVMLHADGIYDADKKNFDDRCACAVACGYIPCGNALQVAPDISSELWRHQSGELFNRFRTEYL